jgi:hypothetical protein
VEFGVDCGADCGVDLWRGFWCGFLQQTRDKSGVDFGVDFYSTQTRAKKNPRKNPRQSARLYADILSLSANPSCESWLCYLFSLMSARHQSANALQPPLKRHAGAGIHDGSKGSRLLVPCHDRRPKHVVRTTGIHPSIPEERHFVHPCAGKGVC